MFGFGESEFAEGMEAIPCRPFGEFIQLVEPEKAVAQTEIEVARAKGFFQLPFADREKFIEIDSEPARGPKMVDDSQRHEHGTGPIAHLPEIDVEPFSDEQDFAGDRRDMVPADQPDEGEVKL